jgi:hypothetical protein
MDEVHINQHVNLQDNAMSHKKCQEFDIILQHSQQKKNPKSLMMIIQGIVGTRKYYLISCIKASFNMHSPYGKILILLLAPIGVATFNIEVTTILATLKIPVKNFQHLQAHTLAVFQEEMKHIRYVLIYEMSFIWPKIFM